MKSRSVLKGCCLAGLLAAVSIGVGMAAQDRNTVKVPGGLGFAEFQGYEKWEVVSMSLNHGLLAVIVGNPTLIQAYKSGIPANGKPFPDGSRMAKIHFEPKTAESEPGQPLVPNIMHDVDFMVKDSTRFADSGGWGYAVFKYDAASESFSPGTLADKPPQGHDAKCGVACHTVARSRDYVFTEYPKR